MINKLTRKLIKRNWFKLLTLVALLFSSIAIFSIFQGVVGANLLASDKISKSQNQEDFVLNTLNSGVISSIGDPTFKMVLENQMNLSLNKYNEVLDKYAEKYNFTYEYQKYYDMTYKTDKKFVSNSLFVPPEQDQKDSPIQADESFERPKVLKILDNDVLISKPYLINGKFPEAENEIALTEGYLKGYDYKIGDQITLNEQTYKITGSFGSPTYVTLVNQGDFFPNEEYFSIAILSDQKLESLKSNSLIRGTYQKDTSKTTSKKILKEITEDKDFLVPNTDLKYITQSFDKSAITSIATFDVQILQDTFLSLILYSIFILMSIILVNILLSKILMNFMIEIGVLKAFGYSEKQIIRGFIKIPVVVITLGVALGGIVGYYVGIAYGGIYHTSFSLPDVKDFYIKPMYLLVAIVLPVCIIFGISFLTIKKIISYNTIDLLKKKVQKKQKEHPLLHKIDDMIFNRSFKFKMRFRLLQSGMSRILVLFLGILIATFMTLMPLTMISSMNEQINSAVGIFNDQYLVIQKSTEINEDPNHYLSITPEILKFTSNNDLKGFKKLEAGTLSVMVIDPKMSGFSFKKSEKDNALEGIVLTSDYRDTYGVAEGDVFLLNTTTETFEVKVSGFTESKLNSLISEKYYASVNPNYVENTVNSYTSTTKVAVKDNVLLVLDVDNLIKQIYLSLQLMYVMVGIFALFAFITVAPILFTLGGIIVDDNKKNIATMKAFGYNYKKIHSMMINIYTPVVVVSYVVAALITKYFLKWVFNTLSTSFDLPIKLATPWYLELVGFLIIYAIYFLSIQLSKRRIKKISVNEVLKIED